MYKRSFFLSILSIVFLSSCYTHEVDLINIEVEDDLSTTAQIVVSPLNSDPDSETAEEPAPGETPTPTVEPDPEAEAERREQYFQETKEEFESCGFSAVKNRRYDEAGVSGSQSFDSRVELEEAFDCLSYVTDQNPPIKLSYPKKTENLFQTNYELRLGVQNPDRLFGYGGFLGNTKPVEEIRITLPGRITDAEGLNQSSNVRFQKTEDDLGVIIINVEELELEDEEMIRNFMRDVGIETKGFDFARLTSQNETDSQRAGEELIEMFVNQTGIDPETNPEEFETYVSARIPPYTTIVVKSKKSKIDISLATTIVLSLLPFFVSFLVFTYKRKQSKKGSTTKIQ